MESFNIVLTSGGFNDLKNYVSDENVALFRSIAKGKKVMILANAAPQGGGNYPAREAVKQNFLKVGAGHVDIVELSEANMEQMLDYDVLYGIGGNPTYLIELNKNPDFKATLVKFLKNGIYIGESAGSMILGADLEWAYIVKKGTKPKYDVQLETYKGLGLTELNIFPHWNKVSEGVKEKVESYEQEKAARITKLSDGEVIKISAKLIGT